jgi:hypothetical protein
MLIPISGKQLKYGNSIMGDQSTVTTVNLSGLSIHESIKRVSDDRLLKIQDMCFTWTRRYIPFQVPDLNFIFKGDQGWCCPILFCIFNPYILCIALVLFWLFGLLSFTVLCNRYFTVVIHLHIMLSGQHHPWSPLKMKLRSGTWKGMYLLVHVKHMSWIFKSRSSVQFGLKVHNAYTYIGQAVEIWKFHNGRPINGHNRKSLRT